MDSFGRYGSFMDGLLRRQAGEAGDEGSLDWLDRLRADVAADRGARWDAAGSGVDVVPGVTVGASDVLVESRDITPAPVDRGGGVVSFPREVESRAMEGVVPAGDGGIDFSRVGEGVLGALSAFERQTSGQLRYLADWVRSGERPEGLDPESEWGDIFRDAGLSEPVSAVLGFGLALMEPGIPGVGQVAKVGKVGGRVVGLADDVNPVGLAAGVAGDAIRSAPPLQYRGGLVRNLELVEPNPGAVIRDLDAAQSANVPIAIAGHPSFRRLREDAHALYAIGYDPRDFRRDGATGLILPRPTDELGKTRDKGFRTIDAAYETVMNQRDVIMEYFQRGVDIGAERWYDGDEILNIFIEAMGDPLSGRAAFDMFNEISAISSSSSPVPQEMGRAIYLWTQLLAGTNPGQISKEMLPRGLGNLGYEGSMRPGLRRFDEGIDPFLKRLKTPAYAANKSGDFSVFTGDRWMTGIVNQIFEKGKLTSGDPFTYGLKDRGFYDAYVDLAKEVGLTPAEFQAAVWVGSGAIQRPEAYTQVFFNRMGALAKERGISITDATQRWMRGELGLQDILGGNIVSDLSRRAAFEVRQDRMNQENEGEPSE